MQRAYVLPLETPGFKSHSYPYLWNFKQVMFTSLDLFFPLKCKMFPISVNLPIGKNKRPTQFRKNRKNLFIEGQITKV